MKTKTLFIAVFVIALLIIVGFAGYLYIEKEDQVTPVSRQEPSNSVSTTNLQQPSTQSSSQQLQVLGEDSQLRERGSNNTLPLPSEFSVYEEYASNEGALFIDVLEGTGQEAVTGDTVAMVYQGWLTNGQLFDQSRPNEEGLIQPFVFQLGARQVIPGWDQAIVGMKQGGQRRLIIPSVAGYGAAGQGSIPPDSMLIFDVELVAIQQTSEQQP